MIPLIYPTVSGLDRAIHRSMADPKEQIGQRNISKSVEDGVGCYLESINYNFPIQICLLKDLLEIWNPHILGVAPQFVIG